MIKYIFAFLLCFAPCTVSANWATVINYYNAGGADVTAPELSSATIDGEALVINYTEAVTQGAGYNDADIDVDCSTTGANLAVTYGSGNGTSQHSYTVASPAVEGETCDLDFNGDANSLEDGAGNDLAAITSGTITNNTTAATEDTCATDGLVLSWHMEDIDLANEDGCSVVGDTTWAANDGATLSSADKSEGTYSLYGANNSDYYVLTPTQNIPIVEGTIIFDVRIGSYSDLREFFAAQYDADNRFACLMANGSGGGASTDIRCTYETATVIDGVTANTNIDPTENKWYRVKWQYKTAEAGNDNKIEVWELDTSTPRVPTGAAIATTTEDDDITAMANAPTDTKLGVLFNAGYSVYMDIFEWYNGSADL